MFSRVLPMARATHPRGNVFAQALSLAVSMQSWVTNTRTHCAAMCSYHLSTALYVSLSLNVWLWCCVRCISLFAAECVSFVYTRVTCVVDCAGTNRGADPRLSKRKNCRLHFII